MMYIISLSRFVEPFSREKVRDGNIFCYILIYYIRKEMRILWKVTLKQSY